MVRTMTEDGALETRGCNALRVSGTASTRDVDAHKSVVLNPDFSRWLKNPIITFQHKVDEVVGVGLSVIKGADGRYRLDAMIYEEDAREKVSDGRLRGLSIGFDPVVTYTRTDGVTVYVRPVVVEVSVCSLPSNVECTIDTVACANKEEMT